MRAGMTGEASTELKLKVDVFPYSTKSLTDDWVALVSGSATPFLCEMTDEFVRLSQQKYQSNKTIEAMVALTFFGIGFGAVGGMLYLTKSQYTQQITEIVPLVIGGIL